VGVRAGQTDRGVPLLPEIDEQNRKPARRLVPGLRHRSHRHYREFFLSYLRQSLKFNAGNHVPGAAGDAQEAGSGDPAV
jgi:hypothetical protein